MSEGTGDGMSEGTGDGMSGSDGVEGIWLQTPCRLHLGIFSLPEGGYGGIGVAIDQPNVRLTATRSQELAAGGPQSDRALAAAAALQQAYGLADSGATIAVESAITPHVGLGSGTQIALAAGAAVSHLWNLDVTMDEVAQLVGRGARSRIGLEAFARGGFVAHAAWRSGETATRLCPCPPAWRWVVAAPETEGLSGEAETTAFAELPPMSAASQREVRDLVEVAILPGVTGGDISRFGRGLMAVQTIVGDYFAPVQGGRYAHPLGERLAGAMLAAGAAGVAQSSWGPSICGVVAGDAEAERVRTAVLGNFPAMNVWVAAADNHGTRWEAL